MELKGRVSLVTGSSRGIGRGLAIRLAREGADVVINYLSSKDEAEKVSREIKSLGRRCVVIKADVTDISEVEKMFDTISKEFGRLDILINNAGRFFYKPVAEMTREEWLGVLDVNLNGTFYCSKFAIPLMRKQKWGRIINIGAIEGVIGKASPGAAAYAAAKSGMIAFTRCLALEEGDNGITVNIVTPGIVNLEMSFEEAMGKNPELPLGRVCTVDDIAEAVLFLASNRASYITGATITVSGGWGL